MTSLNYTEVEIKKMCDMERDTIDLALRYYCEYRDWGKLTNKNNNMDLLSIFQISKRLILFML